MSNPTGTVRFQIQVTAGEERLLRAAAASQGEGMSAFIIRAAREQAEEVLASRTFFVLDEDRWKMFMDALDRPAEDKPRLKRLLSERHPGIRRS